MFYVALTSAKGKVYLIGERDSIFIKEITRDPSFKEFIHIPQDEHKPIKGNIPPEWLCPKCGQGRIWKKSGKFSDFLACNRYPNCEYTKSLKRR